VRGTQGFHTTADMVLVRVGVRPLTDVAKSAGVATGVHGVIRVTLAMEPKAMVILDI
jgi:pyruvate/2-oxoglutarate dehydrogenase complex dihydrolipoamide dehydrogenase (E3) component